MDEKFTKKFDDLKVTMDNREKRIWTERRGNYEKLFFMHTKKSSVIAPQLILFKIFFTRSVFVYLIFGGFCPLKAAKQWVIGLEHLDKGLFSLSVRSGEVKPAWAHWINIAWYIANEMHGAKITIPKKDLCWWTDIVRCPTRTSLMQKASVLTCVLRITIRFQYKVSCWKTFKHRLATAATTCLRILQRGMIWYRTRKPQRFAISND